MAGPRADDELPPPEEIVQRRRDGQNRRNDESGDQPRRIPLRPDQPSHQGKECDYGGKDNRPPNIMLRTIGNADNAPVVVPKDGDFVLHFDCRSAGPLVVNPDPRQADVCLLREHLADAFAIGLRLGAVSGASVKRGLVNNVALSVAAHEFNRRAVTAQPHYAAPCPRIHLYTRFHREPADATGPDNAVRPHA